VEFDATLDAIAELATEFNGAHGLIDQYAAEPIRQGLGRRGVHVTEQPWTNESKLDAVAATRRLLQGHLLDLPQHGELVGELIALESHALPSGRPRIAAPPGSHDDHATALLALVAARAEADVVGLVHRTFRPTATGLWRRPKTGRKRRFRNDLRTARRYGVSHMTALTRPLRAGQLHRRSAAADDPRRPGRPGDPRRQLVREQADKAAERERHEQEMRIATLIQQQLPAARAAVIAAMADRRAQVDRSGMRRCLAAHPTIETRR
jgi:hypothetical protein